MSECVCVCVYRPRIFVELFRVGVTPLHFLEYRIRIVHLADMRPHARAHVCVCVCACAMIMREVAVFAMAPDKSTAQTHGNATPLAEGLEVNTERFLHLRLSKGHELQP